MWDIYHTMLMVKYGNENEIIKQCFRDASVFSKEEFTVVLELIPLAKKWSINKFMYYYLLVDPDKPTKCKVGVTKDPKQRIRAYKTAAPQCFFHKVYNDIDRQHEKRILEELRGHARVDSEYVHCHPHMVQNIVEGYFLDHDIDF